MRTAIFSLLVLSIVVSMQGMVFSQDTEKLYTYIDHVAEDNEDRLPNLGMWLAMVRTSVDPLHPAHAVLSDVLEYIREYTSRVEAPEGFLVMSPDFLDLVKDTMVTRGWSQAPIVIVEFADFQCPYCQQQAKANVLENIQIENPQTVRTSFAQFPLGGQYHALAQGAAVAMECVYDQAGLDAALTFKNTSFHTNLQPTLARMRSYVRDIQGVDEDLFSDCVEDQETLQRVGLQRQIGVVLGVRGTPYTTVIDTRSAAYITLGGVQTTSSLQKYIDTFMAQ